jgi:signal transduction histidine kinase
MRSIASSAVDMDLAPTAGRALGSTRRAGRRRATNPERVRAARTPFCVQVRGRLLRWSEREIPTLHPYLLVPLATALASGALAAATLVREPTSVPNRLMAACLLCAVWWSVFQVLWMTTPDMGRALLFARFGPIGSAMLSPLSAHLLVSIRPAALRAAVPLLPVGYATALGVALVSATTDSVVPAMQWTSWGYMPVVPSSVLFTVAALGALPAITLMLSVHASAKQDEPRSPWIEIAVGIPLAFASITDLVLPLSGVPVLQLGNTCVAVSGLLSWLYVYRFRGARLTPGVFAREILSTLPDGVALVRHDGRIRAVNAKLASLAKREADALISRPLSEVIVETASNGAAEREGELVNADGVRSPVSLSETWLHDAQGFVLGRVLVVRDLEEMVSLRSRLLTSARLAAVGQLAAGIAHEINNPIAYVRSNVGLLERHWKTLATALAAPAPPQRAALARSGELLQAAAEGIDRVASIVRDVGGFSSKGGSENELADPIELLETAVRVAGPQLRRRASVERQFVKLPLVPSRPQELMQVFLNLLLAGVNAIPERGRILLASGVDGGFAWIEITVEGARIAPEALARIFDPFSSLASGTTEAGLGLAISRQIVERLGGGVLVESQPGRGMRFRVSLPTSAPPLAEVGL